MFSERIERLTSSVVRDILAAAQRPGMISFAGGLPSADALSVPDWSTIPGSALQYGPTEGEPELREAVCRHVRGLGIDCDASQVLIVSGSQQGIDLVAKLFIDPGTPVITEAPTYLAALQVFELFGAECHGIAMGPDGVDAEALRAAAQGSGARLAYLIPTFQNPSGTCYSSERREEVASCADELGIVVFEDDPYRDIAFSPGCRTPVCAHLRHSPWIYQGSLSKSFLPGIRIGFMVASPDLIDHLVRLKQAADLHTNRLGQHLAAESLSAPDREERMDALRRAYAGKRDDMEAALEAHMSDIADWETPGGGLFFWLRLREHVDTSLLLPEMIERGVAFVPGEVFFPKGSRELGHMRLNFSHASAEQMDRGLALLAEAVAKQRPRTRADVRPGPYSPSPSGHSMGASAASASTAAALSENAAGT